jgi:hypothetical protein
LLKLDVEQLKETVAAPPQSNAGRVADGRNRALFAKAPDGFRESLARFRAIGPPPSLTSVGRILNRFLGGGLTVGGRRIERDQRSGA